MADAKADERGARQERAWAMAFPPLTEEERAWLATNPSLAERCKRLPWLDAFMHPASGGHALIVIAQLDRIIELLESGNTETAKAIAAAARRVP